MFKQSKFLFNFIICIAVICASVQVVLFVFIIFCANVPTIRLEQVVILSRHNVRTPLSKNLASISPHQWPVWNKKPGYLTDKGYFLEQRMGEFFYSWLYKEKLLHKGCPTKKDFFVYANFMQRTIYSAKAFLSTSFPDCDITIHHGDENKPDPIYSPYIHNATLIFKNIALKEMYGILNNLNLTASYKTMEKLLDYNESVFCRVDKKCDMITEQNNLNIFANQKPKLTGPLKICNEATDAFLMAYYNGFPSEEVAWGQMNNTEQWDSILNLTCGYHKVAYGTKHVARDIAYPLIRYINDIFLTNKSKVTLLMGHDVNINVLISAMSFKPYKLKDSFVPTPIGGKVVFQKWFDSSMNKYLAKIEYVYQTNEQLRNGLPLSLSKPPKFELLELENCKLDNKGFCPWDDFINNLNLL